MPHCCVCVIDSQYMRWWWSMFASGHFTQWALSPACCWPALQALFSHPTIGFLSATVTLTINNTQYYICSVLFNFPCENKGGRTALNEAIWVCLDFLFLTRKLLQNKGVCVIFCEKIVITAMKFSFYDSENFLSFGEDFCVYLGSFSLELHPQKG